VLELWAKLQAMLQAILQAAGPVGYYYKVFKGRFVKRKVRACWPLFLGVLLLSVLLLDPRFGRFWILVFGRFVTKLLDFRFGRFLGVLFLDPRFWMLKWSAAMRPTVACIGCESRVVGQASVLKVFRVRGSMRVIKDILLSEYNGGDRSRENSRASCRKRSEREQGREMA
jgi:hypothetical protein